MFYVKAIVFGFSLPGVFFMGAIHPVLGWLSLAAWLFVLLPMFWRAARLHNVERDEKRRMRNIETQILAGKQDAWRIRHVAEQMKRDGRL